MSGYSISIDGTNNDSNFVLDSASASVSDVVDVTEVKSEVAGVKTDVAGVKTDVAGVKTDVAGVKTDVAGVKTDVAGVKTDVAGVKTDVLENLGTVEGGDEIMKVLGDQIIKEHYIAEEIKGTTLNFQALKNKPALSYTFKTSTDISWVSAIPRQMAYGDSAAKVIELTVLNDSYQEIYKIERTTDLSTNPTGGALLTNIQVDPYGRYGNPDPIEWHFPSLLRVKQLKFTIKEIHEFDRAGLLSDPSINDPSNASIASYFSYGSWNVGFAKISMYQNDVSLVDQSVLTESKNDNWGAYANGAIDGAIFDPENPFENAYDPSFGSYPASSSDAYKCWCWCGYQVLRSLKQSGGFKAAIDDRALPFLDMETRMKLDERYVIGERLFGDPQMFKFLKYKPSASVEFPESRMIVKTEVHSRQMAFLDAAIKTVRVRALDASNVEVYDTTLDTSVEDGTILLTDLSFSGRGTEGLSSPLTFELSGNTGLMCKKLIYEILDVWRYEPPSSDASFNSPSSSRLKNYEEYVNGNSWNFGFKKAYIYDDASTNPITDFSGFVFTQNRAIRTKSTLSSRKFEYAFLNYGVDYNTANNRSNYYLWPGIPISNGIRQNTICASINSQFRGEKVANVPEDEFTLELRGKVLHKNLYNKNALVDYYEVGNQLEIADQDSFNDGDDGM